ncbi:hypothetical protein QYE76_020540 [Lolium multiflorum]|uniref:F-box domain-containing protein n=1 Tax=Lolium multiflorum TaxID=4521 RepID=A0AAD8R507_LOLMU|nr:hypothetical protein QYE76_020540 [Lolium multiflorum]
MEDLTRLLPPDVLADVLRRLDSPRRLAASRCVCKAWRGVVDAYRLLRTDLLPLSLGGIFTYIHGTDLPKYFSPVSSETIAPFDYLGTHDVESLTIMQHCNGLLLLGEEEVRVLNPATRQWACLPSPPPMFTPCMEGAHEIISSCTTDHDMYLVFDPMMSSEFKIFLIKYVPNHPSPDCNQLAKPEVHAREWPPSTFVFLVFSSETMEWEEKPFIREGDAAGTVGHMFQVDTPRHCYATYWRGALYVHQHDFLMRITLAGSKYQVIKLPTGLHEIEYDYSYVGKSEKGVYYTSLYGYDGLRYGYNGYGLRVWFLEESRGHMKWDLKCEVNLKPLLANFPWKCNDKPWALQHGNDDHSYTSRVLMEEKFDWGFDYYNPHEPVYIPRRYAISLLGFHPNKEVVFFHTPSKRVVAYHFDSSKIEDLGFLPTEHPGDVYISFPYMPCRTGELSDN